jgi:hypothetical protein
MKTIFIIAALAVCGSAHCFGQGSIIISNSGGQPVICQDGTRIPVGTTFMVEAVYAPDGTSSADFDAMATRIGGVGGFGPTPGFFSLGGRTIDQIQPPGGFALIQVRVWSSAHGTSYNHVLASGNPNASLGKSGIVRVDTANPLIGEANASLVAAGLGQIIVYGGQCVPEPSTLALGVIGGAALLLMLRRKRAR